MQRSRPPATRDSIWTIALLAVWIFAAAAVAVQTAERTGVGAPQWFGWWDAIVVPAGEPFIVRFAKPREGGAAAGAGIRDGDRADLRALDLDTRVRVLWQPLATRYSPVTIRRPSGTVVARVRGSTLSGGSRNRRILFAIGLAPAVGFLACTLLIILRRSRSAQGRAIALYILCIVIARAFAPVGFVAPSAALNVVFTSLSALLSSTAMVILVHLSSTFGARYRRRRFLEASSYGFSALAFATAIAGCIGVLTVWFDPAPLILGVFWSTFRIAATILVAITAIAAVAASSAGERPRAGWLLLPLPLALALNALADATAGAQSWAMVYNIVVLSSALSMAGAVLVTYALLKRRVLDVGFFLSRSIVVAIVSLTIIAAFVLLEWFLGAVVTGVSHTTGIVANAGLALILGLSMRFIHQRVDRMVDALLFRTRRENTRALTAFAREAAFVTNSEALIGLAIDKLRKHTDARSAALFFRENGSYRTARSFNDSSQSVSENDPGVLALRTWHQPIDPHSYETALQGDLALPMVARGQLVGILLCGERTGSEAYAPDEVEALAQFAQGIGSAYDYFRYANSHATFTTI